MRVILIEDNPGDAKLIEQRILDSGIDIQLTRADRLEAGIARCAESSYDVALLDLGLPDSQGIATLQLWRKRVKHVPVVVLSNDDGDSVGVQALHEGAQDYLSKNKIDRDSLSRSLVYAVERHRAVARQLAAEKQSRETEERFQILFDHSLSAIVVLTWNCRIVDVNPAACRLLGRDRSQILGKSLIDLAPEQHRGEMQKTLQVAGEFDHKPVEGQWWNAAGESVPIEVQSTVIVIGGDPCLMLHVSDVSERKALRAELQQAQKLEAIGQLAGGVAHDFNNLLTIINGYCELLMTHLASDHSLRTLVQPINEAGKKATQLTRQLLAFSRKQMLQPTPLDMNQVVSDMKKLIERLIGAHIQVHSELADKVDTILADPGQMEQIIINLSVNARDAMPNGGDFFLTTKMVEWGDAERAKRPEIKPGRYVEFTVRDTGAGIPEEARERVFEPFFTTKEVGKGTGLGLATVYGIVKQSKGYIYLDSTEGEGTSCSLYFPVASETLHAYVGVPHEEMPTGNEVVLLVEDEEGVRKLTQRILQRCGFTVLDAADGEQGLAIFEQNKNRIEIVVTDLVMPKMSGREMVERFLIERPDLRVVYVSGYTSDAVAKEGICENGLPFLQKPFTAQALVSKVRACLDS